MAWWEQIARPCLRRGEDSVSAPITRWYLPAERSPGTRGAWLCPLLPRSLGYGSLGAAPHRAAWDRSCSQGLLQGGSLCQERPGLARAWGPGAGQPPACPWLCAGFCDGAVGSSQGRCGHLTGLLQNSIQPRLALGRSPHLMAILFPCGLRRPFGLLLFQSIVFGSVR